MKNDDSFEMKLLIPTLQTLNDFEFELEKLTVPM